VLIVLTDALGRKQYRSGDTPVAARPGVQGSSAHWEKPSAPHAAMAAARSMHWHGAVQETVCGCTAACTVTGATVTASRVADAADAAGAQQARAMARMTMPARRRLREGRNGQDGAIKFLCMCLWGNDSS
jgi:hypothetical protein